jgi:serine/threonine protein kinase
VVHRQSFQKDKPFEREYTGILKVVPVSQTHEGLVDLVQVGRDEPAQCFYYVMELADDALRGGDIQADRYLPKTLHQVLEQQKRLPFGECLKLAMGLASALGHLHDHCLIHRDIKPSNIIFVKGRPKLADIGLVTDVSDATSFVGTEGYIPPEGPGTPAADLFSLGKVIYEMATGLDRKAYPELPADFHARADHAGLVELNEIVVKACANQGPDRYQSVADLMADLALLQGGRSVRKARTMVKRLAQAKRMGAFATLAALVLAVGWIFTNVQARRAMRAEKIAHQRLYDSLLAQSRYGRLSGVPGHRLKTLEAIRQGAEIEPSLELRN